MNRGSLAIDQAHTYGDYSLRPTRRHLRDYPFLAGPWAIYGKHWRWKVDKPARKRAVLDRKDVQPISLPRKVCDKTVGSNKGGYLWTTLLGC